MSDLLLGKPVQNVEKTKNKGICGSQEAVKKMGAKAVAADGYEAAIAKAKEKAEDFDY